MADDELPSVDDLAEDAAGESTADRVAAMLAANAQEARRGGGWRGACANCLGYHKLAIMAVSKKLVDANIQPGTEQFMAAMNQAVATGQMMAENPFALQGMNGTKPDIIPVVRPADTMVSGTLLCAVCYQPQQAPPGQSRTGLLLPGLGDWRNLKGPGQ